MRWMLFLAFASCIAIAACSTTPGDLERKKSAAREEQTYPVNYQEVFRRLNGTAKRCLTTPGQFESMQVDGQLYPDLGFAEVSNSLISYGQRNYYWTARIEKVDDTTAKVVVVSGNSLAQNTMLRYVLRWADGDEACFPASKRARN